MRRIGVFVCHCGSNIAATVDVKKVVEMVEKGLIGKLVEIESADGDTVEVVVE